MRVFGKSQRPEDERPRDSSNRSCELRSNLLLADFVDDAAFFTSCPVNYDPIVSPR